MKIRVNCIVGCVFCSSLNYRLPDEVLVGKLVPVDGFPPGSVPPCEVASLRHETRNNPVEDRVLLIRSIPRQTTIGRRHVM